MIRKIIISISVIFVFICATVVTYKSWQKHQYRESVKLDVITIEKLAQERKSSGVNIGNADDIISQANKSIIEGDFSSARKFAREAKKIIENRTSQKRAIEKMLSSVKDKTDSLDGKGINLNAVQKSIEKIKQLFNIGEYELAFKELIKTDELLTNYQNGEYFFEQGVIYHSITLINKAIEMNPEDSRFYSARGDIFFEEMSLVSAKSEYEKALEKGEERYNKLKLQLEQEKKNYDELEKKVSIYEARAESLSNKLSESSVSINSNDETEIIHLKENLTQAKLNLDRKQKEFNKAKEGFFYAHYNLGVYYMVKAYKTQSYGFLGLGIKRYWNEQERNLAMEKFEKCFALSPNDIWTVNTAKLNDYLKHQARDYKITKLKITNNTNSPLSYTFYLSQYLEDPTKWRITFEKIKQ